MAKHWLVCVGFLGCKRCYLDISEAEAKTRFLEDHDSDELYGEDDEELVSTIYFDEEFDAYDAGPGDAD